jgi:phosphopantothenoylcysteine synthetase/decarboxylase
MIVANDVAQRGIGFEVDTNQVTMLCADGWRETTPRQLKTAIARRVIARCLQLLSQR